MKVINLLVQTQAKRKTSVSGSQVTSTDDSASRKPSELRPLTQDEKFERRKRKLKGKKEIKLR